MTLDPNPMKPAGPVSDHPMSDHPMSAQSMSEPRLRGMDLVHPSLRESAYLDCRRRAELIAEQAAKLPPK